ncbi:aldehyde dehydrogenase [Streptomyces venezuelae]|uniref:Aldehyde dehydrogenase n=1 Tax=Streptomyces venezuelae TaxID=54571 RepID=A0A5P2CQ65_STRVZ|nr:aldehyde dehydrogenase family protein [Streptomyces venezuelae]QES42989.1 aldehyde dehydrogenase [Streptomyces venezuelae]
MPASTSASASASASPSVSASEGPVQQPLRLDALGPRGEFRARNRQPVTDVTGALAAELSLVPPPFVSRTHSALRRAEPAPPDERVRRIATAADLFATGTVAGLGVAEYRLLVSRVGGVPLTEVASAVDRIAERLRDIGTGLARARPAGAVTDWRDPQVRGGRAAHTRRGDVFAVHAAGNHPGTHSLWPEALALGFRVAVRPSRREPFTPHRLVSALRLAGFGNDEVTLLPTDHAGADAVLRGADLGLVYGGDDVVRKYGADPTVLLQGPGRSKILLTADVDWHDHLDTIVDSVAGRGGTGCVNATAVLVEGDPTPLCEALTERFSALPSLPPEHPEAVLPVQPAAGARALAEYVGRRAEGTRPWLGADTVADELGDGSAVLRPAVHQLDRATAPQLGAELPFPCVWVAPWRPADDGLSPLRDTLVLTALTHQEPLLDRLLADPTIANLYIGDHPTHWMRPGLPHDGYLSDFLMRTKTLIRT